MFTVEGHTAVRNLEQHTLADGSLHSICQVSLGDTSFTMHVTKDRDGKTAMSTVDGTNDIESYAFARGEWDQGRKPSYWNKHFFQVADYLIYKMNKSNDDLIPKVFG